MTNVNFFNNNCIIEDNNILEKNTISKYLSKLIFLGQATALLIK